MNFEKQYVIYVRLLADVTDIWEVDRDFEPFLDLEEAISITNIEKNTYSHCEFAILETASKFVFYSNPVNNELPDKRIITI